MNRRRSLPSRLQKARLVRTVDLNSTHRLDLVLAPKHLTQTLPTPKHSTPTSAAKDPDYPRLNTTFPTHLEIKFPTRTLSYTRAKASRPARTSSYSKALDCNSSSASRLPSRSSSFVRQVRTVINSSFTYFTLQQILLFVRCRKSILYVIDVQGIGRVLILHGSALFLHICLT